MNIGKLNRLITIQRPNPATNEYGEPVGGWIDVASVWANVRHISGMETLKSDADISIVRASIRIRRRRDVDAGMRVLVDGKTYDIRAVLDDVFGREYCDLTCEQGANNG